MLVADVTCAELSRKLRTYQASYPMCPCSYIIYGMYIYIYIMVLKVILVFLDLSMYCISTLEPPGMGH